MFCVFTMIFLKKSHYTELFFKFCAVLRASNAKNMEKTKQARFGGCFKRQRGANFGLVQRGVRKCDSAECVLGA